MSRTYKDRPSRIRYPDEYKWRDDSFYQLEEYFTIENVLRVIHLKRPGVYTKKKRCVDTEWRWMTTPGWWVREMMTRPARRRNRVWEANVRKANIDELEDEDPPLFGRKPHVYYW